MSDQNQTTAPSPGLSPSEQPAPQGQGYVLNVRGAAPASSFDATVLNRLDAERARADQAEARLRALEAEARKRDETEAQTKAKLAEVTASLSTTAAERAQIETARKSDLIKFETKTAAKDAIDADEVYALVSGMLVVNDQTGRVVSKDDPTKGVDQVVREFLEKKPHLARSKVAAGTGAPMFPQAAPTAGGAPTFDLTTQPGATAALNASLARFINRQPPQGHPLQIAAQQATQAPQR